MSLKARIKRLQAGAKWLRYDGQILFYERLYEVLQLQQRYDRALERKERADALAAQKAQQARARAEARAQALAEAEARREAVYAAQCAADAAPTQSEPKIAEEVTPSPESPPETHDIPEHMQIRPVHWRVRGPDDWEEECELPEVLHEYDPLEWDSS